MEAAKKSAGGFRAEADGELAGAPSFFIRTLLGSTRIGTKPSRWLRTSSWTMDVLLYMKTSSIATAGTSLTRIRRRALAIEASRPTRSKEMVEAESELIVICRD